MWIKIATAIGVLAALVTAVWLFDDRNETKFARADDVSNIKTDIKENKLLIADSLKQINQSLKRTNYRIDQNALAGRATYIKREMTEIRVQCKTANAYEMPPDARKRYTDFKIELDRINLKMTK